MNALYNLARVTTATTGTGTITLGAALPGFLTFAQAGVLDSTKVSYGISDGANSWVGEGFYVSSGTTLTRLTTFRSTGSGNNTDISLSGSAQVYITPAAEDFRGTTTNDNAEARQIGEYVSASAGSTAITANTQTNITSISLTAGDWDVEGVIYYNPAASTVVGLVVASISSVSVTLSNRGFVGRTDLNPSASTGRWNVISTGRKRISISGTTTIYLVGYTDFVTSTMNTEGEIVARRVR